jgi:hypothetical protein
MPLLAHDISGNWEFSVDTAAGSGSPSFVFRQDGEKLTGTYSGLLGKADLTGTVKGRPDRFQIRLSPTPGRAAWRTIPERSRATRR